MPDQSEAPIVCWRCIRCAWVDCYSAKELSDYGAPTECQEHYHESLVEIDLADGVGALADKAAVEVRQAARALDEAKAKAAKLDAALAQIKGQNP